MGKEAITHNDRGDRVVPISAADWDDWVAAGSTRNWMVRDPLIDWLARYGESRGYKPKRAARGYDLRLDFDRFIFGKAREFESAITALIGKRYDITRIADGSGDIRSLEKAEATFDAMLAGKPVIYQGVLRDPESRTYGSPDLLLRADVARGLFPNCIGADEAAIIAPDLDGGRHYVVVDIKFATLALNAKGTEIANGRGGAARKAQLYIYNRALGRLQGYLPERAFLLGRGWERESKKVVYYSDSALDALGAVFHDGNVAGRASIASAVDDAAAWIRRMRREGGDWDLLPLPSAPELYPNMSSAEGGDMIVDRGDMALEGDGDEGGNWVEVKRWIADEIGELTLLFNVGVDKRRAAHEAGIYRWDDPALTPEILNVRGPKTSPNLDRLLSVNAGGAADILPARVLLDDPDWRDESGADFFVDFEFCSNLDDDFSKLPYKGGQPLIFMIGCGHIEDGDWKFESFVVDELTESDERRIIGEWVAHMNRACARLRGRPRLFHWSPAERIQLEEGRASARARHGSAANWPRDLQWVDLLKVMRDEPIVIRGALAFGLKPVARAMRALGLIETDWGDSKVDGLGAMMGAWAFDREAREECKSMADTDLMRGIAAYNHVDCKALMEIARYLRANH